MLAFSVSVKLPLSSFSRLNNLTKASCNICSSTALALQASLPSFTYVRHCHTTFLEILLLFHVRLLKFASQHPQNTLLLNAYLLEYLFRSPITLPFINARRSFSFCTASNISFVIIGSW